MKTIKFAFIATLIVGLMACDDFFSSSMGSAREYDPANININSGNIKSWEEAAVGNPALARAVGVAINNKMKTMTDNTEKAILMSAAVDFAWIGTDLGTILVSNGLALAKELFGDENGDMEKAVKDLLKDLDGRGLFSEEGFQQAINNFSVSVEACLDPTGTVFISEYRSKNGGKANASNVDKSMLMLFCNSTDLMDFDMEKFDSTDPDSSWANLDGLFEEYKDFLKIVGFDAIKDTLGLTEEEMDTLNNFITIEDDTELPPEKRALAAYFNLLGGNDQLRGDSIIGGLFYDAIVAALPKAP